MVCLLSDTHPITDIWLSAVGFVLSAVKEEESIELVLLGVLYD